MHKVNYRYYCHLTGLEFIQLPESQTACLLKVIVKFSEQPTFSNIIQQLITGVVIAEVHALMYVVLSKAEKHMPYGELVSITIYNVTDEVSH